MVCLQHLGGSGKRRGGRRIRGFGPPTNDGREGYAGGAGSGGEYGY